MKKNIHVYQTILVLCLATLLAFWYWDKSLLLYLAIGLAFIGTAVYPVALLIHLVWMKLALLLGWVNTRILLGVIFFLFLWPLATLRRIFKPAIIAKQKDPSLESYFHTREEQQFPEDFERLW